MLIFKCDKHNYDKYMKEYYGFFNFLEWVRSTENDLIEFKKKLSVKKTECPDFIIETEKERIGVEYVLATTPNSILAEKALKSPEVELLQFHPIIYDEKNTKDIDLITRKKNQKLTSPPLYPGQLEMGWAKVAYKRIIEKCKRLDLYQKENTEIKRFILLIEDYLVLHYTKKMEWALEDLTRLINEGEERINYNSIILISKLRKSELDIIIGE